LLAALRAMFTKNRTEIASEQVVQELVADPDSPWHEYRGRGPITKSQVAALLRDYDIRPVVIHPTKRADNVFSSGFPCASVSRKSFSLAMLEYGRTKKSGATPKRLQGPAACGYQGVSCCTRLGGDPGRARVPFFLRPIDRRPRVM
jgi:hypothetical protein